MNPFEISNHEKQKEKHAAIQFFRSLLSGSGKTTLAMCLAALERPDAGEIWLEGWDLVSAGKQQLAAVRAQLQLLWQDSAGALSPF